MTYHRQKVTESKLFLIRNILKYFLIVATISLFILPPIYYYNFSRNSYQYPFKWQFLHTRIPPKNNYTNIYSFDVYSEKNKFLNCNLTLYQQCPQTLYKFSVCIHDVFEDHFISRNIKHDGFWQPLLTKFLIKVFDANQKAIFIDIGANIGYFSALATTKFHYTIAIEPVPQNLHLLYCTALKNNLFNKMTILSNPISDTHTKVTIRRGGSNQGDGRVEEGVKECTGSCPPTSTTITMNDFIYLLQSTNNTDYPVIIKIDSQGYETKILRGGEEFFSRASIVCIVIEWNLMKSDEKCAIETLQILHYHRFRPYDIDSYSILSKPLHPKDWREWPEDVAWFRENKQGLIIASS